jgi:hypothetical protein
MQIGGAGKYEFPDYLPRNSCAAEGAPGSAGSCRSDRRHAARGQAACRGKVSVERTRLEARLTGIRNRMDAAHTDNLDCKIQEDFWERKMADWRMEEQQIKMALQGLIQAETGDRALDAEKIFELAIKAYSLYVLQNPVKKARLLRMLFSNRSVDAVSVRPHIKSPSTGSSKGLIIQKNGRP